MNCLLIEDSPLKASLIEAHVQEHFPGIELRTERSYQSGLKRISETPPAFIILDMTLPNFDVSPNTRHGKPRPLGGYDILRKLKRRSATVEVFVVTQYESFGSGTHTYSFAELEEKCLREFPDIFRGIVYFSPSSSDWKKALTAALGSIGGNSESIDR